MLPERRTSPVATGPGETSLWRNLMRDQLFALISPPAPFTTLIRHQGNPPLLRLSDLRSSSGYTQFGLMTMVQNIPARCGQFPDSNHN